MPAIFFALVSYVGWGVGSLPATIAARKLGGYSTVVWLSFVGLCLTTFYIPFALSDLRNLTFTVLLVNVLIGLLGWIGGIAGYESLRITNAALAVTIEASYPFLSAILSIFLFKEVLMTDQIVALFIIFIGLIIMALDFKKVVRKNLKIEKGILLALFTFVCFGFYGALIKIPVQVIGWFWPTYISLALLPLFVIYARLNKIKINHFNHNHAFLPVLLTVILFRPAEFAYNLGISKGLVAVVAPIAGANPTLFVILAAIFLKDPITKQQIVGIITTLLGIVLLSTFSV